MGSVMRGVKSIGSSLFGGQSKASQGANYGQMSSAEDNLRRSIVGGLEDQQAQVGNNVPGVGDVNEMFKQHLTSFLTDPHGPNPTPEQQAQAAQFVDQTFTAPTTNALDNYQAKFQAQQQARAASLGRDANLDQSTNQAVFNEGLRNNTALQMERGSRVAQTAQDLNNQSFNRGLGTLNAGLQGSNFLNSLTQQAFSNRLGLLNARSAMADSMQKDRSMTTTNNQQTSPGLLGGIGSGLGQIAQIGQMAGSIGGMTGSLGGMMGGAVGGGTGAAIGTTVGEVAPLAIG